MTEVAIILENLKSKYGTTQRFIAQKVGVTPYYLSECKKGVRKPSQELLDKLRELAK